VAELVNVMLAEFIRAYGEKPWEPGTVDCCLYLAAWAIWLGHSDPARHMRGTYNDETGLRAVVERRGSVVAVVADCAATIGAKRVQQPFYGDIAVIGSATNIHRQFGAIFDGERWLVRHIRTIAPVSAKPLAIWRLV
jgi:hypothetical protein